MDVVGVDARLAVERRRADGRDDQVVELPFELFDEVDELGLVEQGEILVARRGGQLCARDGGDEVERADAGLTRERAAWLGYIGDGDA